MTRTIEEWVGKNDDAKIPDRVRLRDYLQVGEAARNQGARSMTAVSSLQPGTKTPPMSPHARAQYIWAMLKSYMLDECSLECAAVSNSDEANLINLIKNSLTEPDATLQARVAELTWQPIEAAPKDGRMLDLWSTSRGRLTDAYWISEPYTRGEPWGWSNSRFGRITDATHYMPFPGGPVVPLERSGGAT